jgi:hypothetical protein
MKPELKKVVERANDCLEDSRYLLEGKRYEAAVNRAYYSIFTAPEEALQTVNDAAHFLKIIRSYLNKEEA